MGMKYKEGDYIYDIDYGDIFGKIVRIYMDYDRELRIELDTDFHEFFHFTYNFIANNPKLRKATKTEILLYAKK